MFEVQSATGLSTPYSLISPPILFCFRQSLEAHGVSINLMSADATSLLGSARHYTTLDAPKCWKIDQTRLQFLLTDSGWGSQSMKPSSSRGDADRDVDGAEKKYERFGAFSMIPATF